MYKSKDSDCFDKCLGAIWLMELTLSDLVNGSAFIRGDNMRCPFSLVVCCACNGHTLYCHLICSGDLLKKFKKEKGI